MSKRIVREPPESAWFEVDGHRWAATAACLVREDGPRPGRVASYNNTGWGWMEGDRSAAVRKFVKGIDRSAPIAPYYDLAAAPLLRAGFLRATLAAPGSDARVTAIVRGKEPVAFVAPLYSWEDGCVGRNGERAEKPVVPDWRLGALVALHALGGKWSLRDVDENANISYIDGPGGITLSRSIAGSDVGASLLGHHQRHADPVTAVRRVIRKLAADRDRATAALAALGVTS